MKVKNLALAERPFRFSDVVGQDQIMKNLQAQSKDSKFFQAYLFHGYYGCGKTSTARILAAALNCNHKDSDGNPCGVCPACMAVKNGSSDIIEIDAASNTGIENIRVLKESVAYLPTELSKKVYIIDEVHKLSDGAFNALLKVLEEPPQHVVFILATTNPEKIPATVRSRLAKYDFLRIPSKKIKEHLKSVADGNGFTYEEEGLAVLARNSDGSMRNAIKLMEMVSEMSGGITEQNASVVLGLSEPTKLFQLTGLLLNSQVMESFYLATEMVRSGMDVRKMTADMIDICSDLLLAQERPDLIDNSERYKELLMNLKDVDKDMVIFLLTELMGISEKLRESGGNPTAFTSGILALNLKESRRFDDLEKRVAQLSVTVLALKKSIEEMTVDSVGLTDPSQTDGADAMSGKSDIKLSADEFADQTIAQMAAEFEAISESEETPFAEEEVSGAESEAVSEQEASKMNPSVEQPKEQMMEQAETAIDPFAILGGFNFMSNMGSRTDADTSGSEEPSGEVVTGNNPLSMGSVTEDSDEKIMKETTEDMDVLLPQKDGDVSAALQAIEDEDQVLDNLLALGFTKIEEEGQTTFETDENAFMRIGRGFADAMGGLPFGLRKRANM